MEREEAEKRECYMIARIFHRQKHSRVTRAANSYKASIEIALNVSCIPVAGTGGVVDYKLWVREVAAAQQSTKSQLM